MARLRKLSRVLLAALYLSALAAPWIAPSGYAEQHREHAGEPPSRKFLLGVDNLGRDRFARVVYGTRVSLLLAPTAAALAVAIAALVGSIGGGGVLTETLLAIPTVFLLLIARAFLPLNAGPALSLVLTFAMLGGLGWPAAARIFAARTATLRNASFALQARAAGYGPWRMLRRQFAPMLAPLASAQFFVLVPAFIIAEANLGMLGLGAGEPMPSWGTLLAELTSTSKITPETLVPVALLVLTVAAFRAARPGESEATA